MSGSYFIQTAGLLASLFCYCMADRPPFKLKYEWVQVDYDTKITGLTYENVSLTSVKYWNKSLYMASARFREGVPWSVSKLMLRNKFKSPKLEPFPRNSSVSPIGDCNQLQNVAGIDIDPFRGLLFVVDGIRDPDNFVQTPCPPKLVVYDLKTEKIERSIEFEQSVFKDPKKTFLRNVVVLTEGQEKDDLVVFIADGSENDPGLIVYDWRLDIAKKIRHYSFHANPDVPNTIYKGVEVAYRVGLVNLAISPMFRHGKSRHILCSPYYSNTIYEIYLDLGSLFDSPDLEVCYDVKTFLTKDSLTDGMIWLNDRKVFVGAVYEKSIKFVDPRWFPERILVSWNPRQDGDFNWTDSFAISDSNCLYALINNYPIFFDPNYDLKNDYSTKLQIFELEINTKSSLYPIQG